MATWIAHLRVAENLVKEYKLHEIEFIAGNIGPDCSVPNHDWSSFDPPKKITHWFGEDKGCGLEIEADKFYESYINESFQGSDEEYSFLIGYYVHLLTDIEWAKRHFEKMSKDLEYANKFKENPDFIWEVKKDWYGLDFKYLTENKSNIFDEVFCQIGVIEDYLEYFPKGAFTLQIEYIKNFYRTRSDDFKPTDRYLKKSDMDLFVLETTEKIKEKLDQKNLQ